jgi:hypothetical protein
LQSEIVARSGRRRPLRTTPARGRSCRRSRDSPRSRSCRPTARAPSGLSGRRARHAMVGHAVSEATGRQNRKRPKNDVSNRAAVVLGSGQSRAGLPDGREAAPGARGDRGAASEARARTARAPAHRLAARALPVRRTACARRKRCSLSGGGPQTRPFIFHPPSLPAPTEPIIGAAAVHAILTGWRSVLTAA